MDYLLDVVGRYPDAGFESRHGRRCVARATFLKRKIGMYLLDGVIDIGDTVNIPPVPLLRQFVRWDILDWLEPILVDLTLFRNVKSGVTDAIKPFGRLEGGLRCIGISRVVGVLQEAYQLRDVDLLRLKSDSKLSLQLGQGQPAIFFVNLCLPRIPSTLS